MKPKAKLKKKEARFGQTTLTSSETATKKPDLSQLRKPVDINLSSLKQVAQLLDKGSEEVKTILTYECDVVYECRVCRSLFRSLANFVSHKRVYCLQQYCVARYGRDVEPMDALGMHDMSSAAAQGQRESVASQDGERAVSETSSSLIDTEYEERRTNDRILRSQCTKVELKKDLTTIVDMLTKRLKNDADCEANPKRKRNNSPFCITGDRERILLEIIEPEHAAYQTVLGVEECMTAETDLMKSQALELKNMLNRNTGTLGPDGHFIEASKLSGNNDYPLGEEFKANSSTSENTTCTLCDAKFATKKTLAFHVKSKHMAHRTCYPCPCCTGIFTNRWSVYRHLFKVHRKTNEQVRRLRVQIQARAFRRELSRLERAPKATKEDGTTENCKNLTIAQEWMENLELDAELQRCGGCGKRFERKAALASHLQICQKLVGFGAAREARRKRARKLLPRRVSGIIADTETRSAGGLGNETELTRTISEEPVALGSKIQGGDSCEIPAGASSSSPKPRSSLSRRKSVEPEPKSLVTNEKSEVCLLVDRKLEVSLTERETEAPLSRGLPLANEKFEVSLADGEHAVASSDQISEVSLIDANSELSLTERESESSLAEGKPEASLIHRVPDEASPDRKSEPAPIDGRKSAPSVIHRCYPVMPDFPSEISIRVEDVSSLSKDVWDKMGSGSADIDRVSPSKGSIVEPTNATSGVLSDIPEVIYTSINNSRPVALSVLATEQKLGIQYRGIRLPTVTLEKINVSRVTSTLNKSTESVDEPRISLKSSFVDRPLGTEIASNRQTLPIQKLQCLRCNRKFSTTGNLQKHIAAHMRRNRYRCKLCKDFRSLLKCDIIAHCNKVHNAKNDRAILADLVIDVPVNVDEKLASRTSPVGARLEAGDDLEVIDVAALSNAVRETVAGIVAGSPAVADDAEASMVDRTTALPKPKRGRPPKSKAKRKRKPFVPKSRHSRHVSPPRLPDDTSLNEINDIIVESMDQLAQPSDESNDDPPVRAPSRLKGDPELRKMIMEVIFGSSQKENAQNSRDDLGDNDFEEVLDHRDDSMVTSPLKNETKLIDPSSPDAKIQTDAQAANNNGILGHCRNYKLSTIAVNSDTIFFTENHEVPSV